MSDKKNVPFRNPNTPLLNLNGGQMVSREQALQAQISQQAGALSLGIYSKLACEHLSTLEHSHIDVEKLKTLAKNARTAALAYFEGIGAIEPQ